MNIYEFISFCIDFEGYIGIQKEIKKNSIGFSVKAGISNTSKELLEAFKNKVKFGHIIGPIKKRYPCKTIYIWSITKNEIREYLPKISPYFILKWRQAELVIEALAILKDKKYSNTLSFHQKREMYTYEEFLTLEFCYQECKELNKKGDYNQL